MNNVVRPHVPEEELHAHCDGELSPAQRVEIAEHLMGCLICRVQHAEVEAVRARSAALLSIAVPKNVRRVGTPMTRPASSQRRAPRYATAIAAALVGVGVWFSLKPEITTSTGSQLASSLGMPNLFGAGPLGVDSIGIRDKQLTLAGRVQTAPQVTSSGTARPLVPEHVIGTPAEVDPVFTAGWTASTLADAVSVAGGSLARISGVPVSAVKLHPSANGGRPTFMVRQQLADGRAVWVFEGLEEEIAPVNQVLQASGVATSMMSRTKPDYVGVGADLRVTTRMVMVVGYLAADSLNTLVSKLTLR